MDRGEVSRANWWVGEAPFKGSTRGNETAEVARWCERHGFAGLRKRDGSFPKTLTSSWKQFTEHYYDHYYVNIHGLIMTTPDHTWDPEFVDANLMARLHGLNVKHFIAAREAYMERVQARLAKRAREWHGKRLP